MIISFKLLLMIYVALGVTQFNACKVIVNEVIPNTDTVIQKLYYSALLAVTILVSPFIGFIAWIKNGFKPEKE